MPNTVSEIKTKIAELEQSLEATRQKEKPMVIDAIKAQIADYGISPMDLFPDVKLMPRSTPRRERHTRTIKYKNEKGETWSGGPGRRPKWVLDVLAAGESLEKYAVV
ncbi:H-NS histone family protein [Acidovorax sp. LjRoot129]|uniref:H-NS histone family protein n=1 Tax=unclassified Acidovorax TaxID=2684926 RepID=UPI003ECD1F1F